MARNIKASQATAAKRQVYFQLVDATDLNTPETGEAGGQPQVSIDGAAFSDTGIGTLAHMGNGRYYAELTQAILVVGRILETRYKSANTAEAVGDQVHVVAYDPDDTNLGLTNLDAAISGLPSAASIDTTLTASHGAGSWTGSAVGARSIAFTVNDGVSGIPSALVTVLNAAADTVISVGTCDANGQATISLDDATYTIRFTAAGYTLADQTLVVTANASPTYSMTAFVAPTPADPDNCTIFGYVTDASDVAISGAQVKASPSASAYGAGTIANGKEIKTAAVTTTTNGSGYFTLELIKGMSVRFQIPDAAIDIVKTVPNAASQDYSTW